MTRLLITFAELGKLLPQRLDKLPSPAEFRGMVGRGKKQKLTRLRQRWVGFGWVTEGEATGSEPLLVIDDTVTLPSEEAKRCKSWSHS